MPLEQAIRKITSLPAQREHLVGRGLIKEGFFADITIFDPPPSSTKPHTLSRRSLPKA